MAATQQGDASPVRPEDVVAFLEAHQLGDTAKEFKREWSGKSSEKSPDAAQSPQQPKAATGNGGTKADAAQRTAQSEKSESEASPARHPAARASASDAPDSNAVGAWHAFGLGVDSVPGSVDDTWEIDLSQPTAPAFAHGGGVAASVHDAARSAAKPDFVPCEPYLKAPPPANLPLESFDLRVIYDAGRTGFEDAKEFPINVGSVIAGRYQVVEYLGSAAFSRAVQCTDLKHNAPVCVKIIRNSKDFFDQSLDEIKLLLHINGAGDADENHVLQLYDYFYHKEHMFLVCELLRDNLYEFSKFNREHEEEAYFTLPRVRSIARQVLKALAFVHSLNLLHCDLKPENILIKSYSRCIVKVIDFGSSCFTTDSLSSYIQSRCYRAPEVVLGCHYDGRIDVWSLGAILPELITGKVLFHNETLPAMLARIAAICGPFPAAMLHSGRHTCSFVNKYGAFYEQVTSDDGTETSVVNHHPREVNLASLLGDDDADYVDFVRQCLTVDHTKRPTADTLLKHPFITKVDEA